MKGHYSRLINEFDDAVCPNIAIFLEGPVFNPARVNGKKFANTLSVEMGRCMLVRKVTNPFSMLISKIHEAYHLGGTAETEVFGQYYFSPEVEDVELLGLFPIKEHYVLIEDLYDESDFPVCACMSCLQPIRYGAHARLLDEKRMICASCADGR